MSIITDGAGNELTYWPISGLAEGENSETLAFKIDVPEVGELTATLASQAHVWARKTGDVTWVNISEGSYDLVPLATGVTDFECYVEAVEGMIEGLQRVILTVSVGTSSPAGWQD